MNAQTVLYNGKPVRPDYSFATKVLKLDPTDVINANKAGKMFELISDELAKRDAAKADAAIAHNESPAVTSAAATGLQAAESAAVDRSALEAEIARLKAENAKLAAGKAQTGRISLKVSEKGGLSAYGLGRFPVTLYREQWERLLAESDAIKAFIKANASTLKVKGE